MAKKNKNRGRQSLVSKVANAALIALAFARPLERLFAGNTDYFTKFQAGGLVDEATFGLAFGGFDLAKGGPLYGPVAASVSLGFIKRYVMKKFPVRR